MDIGLSSSEVAYLDTTTDNVRIAINDDVANNDATCETELVLTDQVLSKNSYSGDLPETISPQVDNSQPVITTVASNQFVQVANHGSIDALSPENMHMIGTQLTPVIYTSTSPKICTNQITDMGAVTDVINLNEASITTSSVENLPLISILQCPPENQNAPNTAQQLYLLTMTG